MRRQLAREVRIGSPMFNAIIGHMERKQSFNIDGANYFVKSYKQLNSRYYRFEMVEAE